MTIRLVLLLGVLLRFLLVLFAPDLPDTANFKRTADIVLAGGNIYTEQHFYNYSPVIAHMVAAVDAVRGPIPYPVAHRLFLLVADISVALLIYGRTRDGLNASLYWLVSAPLLYNAQFELWALLPLLITIRGKV